MRAVTRYVVEEKSKLEEVKAGWYTEKAMEKVLLMTACEPRNAFPDYKLVYVAMTSKG